MAWRAEDVPDRVEALQTGLRLPIVRTLHDKTIPATEVDPQLLVRQDDARTLWVDLDGQGERYKPWRTVCQGSRQLDHAGLGARRRRDSLAHG